MCLKCVLLCCSCLMMWRVLRTGACSCMLMHAYAGLCVLMLSNTHIITRLSMTVAATHTGVMGTENSHDAIRSQTLGDDHFLKSGQPLDHNQSIWYQQSNHPSTCR